MGKDDVGFQFAGVRALCEETKRKAKHASKKKNVDLLWSVLEEMRQEGMASYSVAEIARRLAPLGGPKTQSLRNAQGEDFRLIINAYEQVAQAAMPKMDQTQLEVAISLVPDQSVRVVLKEFFAENKRLKHENDMLRSSFKSLSLGEGHKEPSAQVAMFEQLDPFHVEVLVKGLSPSRLRERSLSVTASGAIEDGEGQQLFPPGFVDAVQAVLTLSCLPNSGPLV